MLQSINDEHCFDIYEFIVLLGALNRISAIIAEKKK